MRSYFFFLPLVLLFCCSGQDNVLYVYCWSQYIKPEIVERFEKEYNCHVYIDTFESNESMYAKLKTGKAGYDLAMPSNYFVDLMQLQGLIAPIDSSKIPNLKNLDPEFISLFKEDHTLWAVPYLLGYSAILYRADRVIEPPATWNAFANSELKGRMTMLNDLREVIGAALKFLGYSANTHDPEEIRQAAAIVLNWKRNLAKFESEQVQNGLATAEYLLAQGYSSNAVQLNREDPAIKMIVPNEGTMISIDAWVVMKNAPHPDLALAFINFLCEPEIAAETTLRIGQMSPNLQAKKLLPEEIQKDPRFYLPKTLQIKSDVLKNVGDAIRYYNEAWDEIKEG